MNRKNASANRPQEVLQPHPAANGRAARAAARVAARYANAPSYNQLLADEARNALHAAQVAQRAAEDAHAAVQMVLAGIEAASPDSSHDRSLGTLHELQQGPVLAKTSQSRQQSQARAVAAPPPSASPVAQPDDDPFAEMRLPPLDPSAQASLAQSDAGDQSQAIPANLIEFPREMIATRRLRPRLAEGPLAENEFAPQLSIFEVDPGSVSTEPTAPTVSEPAAPGSMRPESMRPEWMRPEWTIPQTEIQAEEELRAKPEPEVEPVSPVVDLAPVDRRLLSIVIDGALSLAA